MQSKLHGSEAYSSRARIVPQTPNKEVKGIPYGTVRKNWYRFTNRK